MEEDGGNNKLVWEQSSPRWSQGTTANMGMEGGEDS